MRLIPKMWGMLCADGVLIDPVVFASVVAIVLDHVENGHKEQLTKELIALTTKLSSTEEDE